jgi:transposase
VFFYSPDRGGEHPEQHLAGYAGLMQADAYAGFGRLYEANRKAGVIIEAACWAHGRRKFFDLARLSKAPIAAEAVKRIDVLFAIEREINGLAPQERLRVRQERSRALIVDLAGVVTRAARQALQQQRHDQGNQLLPQPLGCIHPLPR